MLCYLHQGPGVGAEIRRVRVGFCICADSRMVHWFVYLQFLVTRADPVRLGSGEVTLILGEVMGTNTFNYHSTVE